MSNGGPRTLSLLGCGCALVVLGITLVVVGFTWFTYRQAKGLAEGITDPAKREAKARKILHYEELPEGYHPVGGFTIPFLFKTAILSDKQEIEAVEEEPGKKADLFNRRGFLFVETPGFRADDSEIRDYFIGPSEGSEETEAPTDFSTQSGDVNLNVQFDVREVLGRGRVPIPRGEALYVARRGRLAVEDKKIEGLSSLIYLDCAEDDRVRFGLWFTPVPDPPTELTGTPADPNALEGFLGHFRVCR